METIFVKVLNFDKDYNKRNWTKKIPNPNDNFGIWNLNILES